MKPRIIAFASERDGVGKTTLAVHMAFAIARLGARVLLIDLDPEGQAAAYLGLPKGNELVEIIPGHSSAPQQVAIPAGRENLFIIRADHSRTGQLLDLSNRYIRSRADYADPDPMALLWLRKVLEPSDFHLIILDTTYMYSPMYLAALAAAEGMFVPSTPNPLSVSAAQTCLETLKWLHREKMSACRTLGVVPMAIDFEDEEDMGGLDKMGEVFGSLLLQPVARDPLFNQAAQRGKTLFEYISEPNRPSIAGIPAQGGRIGGLNYLVKWLVKYLSASTQ
jgi:cellulose biosynthesis protein BcsQ